MANDALKVEGGSLLSGTVEVSGSKNASLFAMAAALLAPGKSVLAGAPDVGDVRNFACLLEHLGASVSFEESRIVIETDHIYSREVPPELAGKSRASVILLGPLVARYGQAQVAFSGGCTIGTRPIGQHLKGLEALGASINVRDGYLVVSTPRGFCGAEVKFDTPTITGTVALMLAAVLAEGETTLTGPATEPEVGDLAKCLIEMGADIRGCGTSRITIRGCKVLRTYDYKVMGDRIECGTLMIAGTLVGDKLVVKGARSEHQTALMRCLREIGAEIQLNADDSITVSRAPDPKPISLQTGPYPGFPTDLQPQMMALLSVAGGTSQITEMVFMRRFLHGVELAKLGAHISIVGNCAKIDGTPTLHGAVVEGADIRGCASLLVAALVGAGESSVRNIHHMDRGFERLDVKLASVGARILRIRGALVEETR